MPWKLNTNVQEVWLTPVLFCCNETHPICFSFPLTALASSECSLTCWPSSLGSFCESIWGCSNKLNCFTCNTTVCVGDTSVPDVQPATPNLSMFAVSDCWVWKYIQMRKQSVMCYMYTGLHKVLRTWTEFSYMV